MTASTATKNKAIRQEALRAQLSNQKHIEKVVDNIEKIEKLDFFQKGDDKKEIDYKLCQANKFRMDALKTANDQRLKLINKYLPDLRSTEIDVSSRDGTMTPPQSYVYEIVRPKGENNDDHK